MTACAHRIKLCIPQHDDRRYVFTVRDQRGLLVDISDAPEITFIIAAKVTGAILLTKLRSTTAIQVNNAHQFTVYISSAESGAFAPGEYYCEVRIENSGGEFQTVGAGTFTVQDTRIGDS
jgi:hypothetical protein